MSDSDSMSSSSKSSSSSSGTVPRPWRDDREYVGCGLSSTGDVYNSP